MYKSKISDRVFVCPPIHLFEDRAVETFESCGYELNVYGHIRNDFATLNDSQTLLDYQRTVARMQEIQANESDNSNRSFEDIVKEVKPRWIQTPAEMDRFEQYLIDNELEYYNDLKAKETEAGASLDIENGDVKPVGDSKAS